MRLQRPVASVVAFLLMAIVPIAAHALRVTISVPDSDTQFVLDPPEGQTSSASGTINLDCPFDGATPAQCPSTTLGSPRVYDFGPAGPKFTIAKCTGTGCSGGRARVTVSDGAVDTLVLTDAVIRNVTGTGVHTLLIRMESGIYTQAGEFGPRAYAAELSGSFVPTTIRPENSVTVTAHACFQQQAPILTLADTTTTTVFIQCFNSDESSRVIDSPIDDGEGEGDEVSVSVPPYKPAGTSQFSPKEQDSENCPDSVDATCIPALVTNARITLVSGYSLRLPGSIGAAGSKDICDLDSADPDRQAGCIAMAKHLASIGPKGAEMYDARLEPSPGMAASINVRGVLNTLEPWVSSRDGGTNGDNNGVIGASQTKVELQTNGAGEVTAKGLCASNPCEANTLPVRLYCQVEGAPSGKTQLVSTVLLILNNRGDGRAELNAARCSDPAVLIMDPTNSRWVAAPVVF